MWSGRRGEKGEIGGKGRGGEEREWEVARGRGRGREEERERLQDRERQRARISAVAGDGGSESVLTCRPSCLGTNLVTREKQRTPSPVHLLLDTEQSPADPCKGVPARPQRKRQRGRAES